MTNSLDGNVNVDPAKVAIFVVDDHEVTRMGVRYLFADLPDLEVVGEAGTCAEAVMMAPLSRPHVAIVDLRLPDGDGVSVCRELRSVLPDLRCLMYSAFDDTEAKLRAAMAGAAGFVLKTVSGNQLISAVRTAAAGRTLLDPSTIRNMLEQAGHLRAERAAFEEPESRLRGHEREILQLIGEGWTNRQIARELDLGEESVLETVKALVVRLDAPRGSHPPQG